jgi:hypothetical protein
MATINPTAVQKTMNALTNQETLTSIMKRCWEIDGLAVKESHPLQTDSVNLAVAILDNPEASKLVEWFTKEVQEDEVSAALAALITAVRMTPTQPTNGCTHKNFSEHYESLQNLAGVPPANILPWPTPPGA